MVQLNMDIFKGKSFDISTYDVIYITVYTQELSYSFQLQNYALMHRCWFLD